MKTSSLTYAKSILKKVSFSALLFEKELKKAIKSLLHREVVLLHRWCRRTFSAFEDIIEQTFTAYLKTAEI